MPPSTRSASGSLSRVTAAATASPAAPLAKRARPNGAPATGSPAVSASPAKSKRIKLSPVLPAPAAILQEASSPTRPKFDISDGKDDSEVLVVRPRLAFNLDEAKEHLRKADSRFHALFERLPCKPFEEDTDLNPFRALCSSILGQQISWLAARSITHKFIRLVAFPELPEKPGPTGMTTLFPTPKQVANADMATLRSAGLSQRKAEYVQDLATRFADGRLSAEGLLAMTDEEVMKALTEVRGIGKWTVEMFMIFTLRRPDVLPHGDLGIQKGLVRWWTQVNPNIHVRKLPNPEGASQPQSTLDATASMTSPKDTVSAPSTPQKAKVAPATPGRIVDSDGFLQPEVPATPSASALPAPVTPLAKAEFSDEPLMTPRTETAAELPPFPESQTLTRSSLRARLSKKVKGNNYLTPQEMDELSKLRAFVVYYRGLS
jgi:DNA-3-methyladenine glycosylase II